MKRDNKKQMLQVAAILLIGSISVILYFFPDLIGGNKYSYKNIYETREEINGLKNSISSGENEIENAKDEMESAVLELEESIFSKNSILIDTYDYQLDIPSLLISLEQNAIKNGVEVEIEYNSIIHDYNGENSLNDSEENMSESQDETQTVQQEEGISEGTVAEESVDEESTEIAEEEQESFTDESSDSLEIHEDNNNKSIRKAYIPIKVKGTYSGARSYIKYLDEVGMLEPDNVKITSNEDYIEAEIGIIVFYGRID